MKYSSYDYGKESCKDILEKSTVTKEIKGRVGDVIEKIVYEEKEVYYCKKAKGKTVSLLREEMETLLWMEDKKILTPRVIAFEQNEDTTSMIISNIEGVPAYLFENIEVAIKIAADLLKKIHSIDISRGTPVDDILEKELKDIETMIHGREILEKDFIANVGKYPSEVYQYLIEKKEIFDKTVYTHGDYCLPNIIININNESGVIDWGQAGIGDKYRDFAAMETSLKKNNREGHIALFYELYGIDSAKINREKINYYHMMDQFHYYKKGNN